MIVSNSIFPCDALLIEFDDFVRKCALNNGHRNPFRLIAVLVLHQIFDVTTETFHIVNAFKLIAVPKLWDRIEHGIVNVYLLCSLSLWLKWNHIRIIDKIGNNINQMDTRPFFIARKFYSNSYIFTCVKSSHNKLSKQINTNSSYVIRDKVIKNLFKHLL